MKAFAFTGPTGTNDAPDADVNSNAFSCQVICLPSKEFFHWGCFLCLPLVSSRVCYESSEPKTPDWPSLTKLEKRMEAMGSGTNMEALHPERMIPGKLNAYCNWYKKNTTRLVMKPARKASEFESDYVSSISSAPK